MARNEGAVGGRGSRLAAPAVVLGLLAAASSLPYLFSIGFTSDDWLFLSKLQESRELEYAERYAYLAANPNLAVRPLQILHMMLMFDVFGVHPLGYHVVTTAFLVAAAVLMFLALRRLRLPQAAAFAASALFVLSPSCSTDRFWFASSGYVLMMAFYFASLLADLRSLDSEGAGFDWRWKAVALAAAACCGLGYEVALPLLAGNVVLLAALMRRRPRSAGMRHRAVVVFLGSSVLLIVLIVGFKLAIAPGEARAGGVLQTALRLIKAASVVQVGSYGVALPSTAWWAIHHVDAVGLTVAGGIGLTVGVSVLHLLRRSDARTGQVGAKGVVLLGVCALVLGYVVFIATPRFQAASTGISNRINIGGALGMSLLLVATIGLARRRSCRRRVASSAAAGLIAFAFALTVGAVSTYWQAVHREQRPLLTRIEAALPRPLPQQAAVILAGACPYRGPVPLFESSWDLSGALTVDLGRRVEADVVTPRLEIAASGLRTTIYGFGGSPPVPLRRSPPVARAPR